MHIQTDARTLNLHWGLLQPHILWLYRPGPDSRRQPTLTCARRPQPPYGLEGPRGPKDLQDWLANALAWADQEYAGKRYRWTVHAVLQTIAFYAVVAGEQRSGTWLVGVGGLVRYKVRNGSRDALRKTLVITKQRCESRPAP